MLYEPTLKMVLRFFSIVLYLLLASSLVAATTQQDLDAWQEYKMKYEKTYSTPAEDQLRMQVFLDNKQFIESHNTKAQASFTQGVNPLSDLTAEEIVKSRCGFRLKSEDSRSMDGMLEALLLALNSTADRDPNYNNATEEQARAWYEAAFTAPSLDWRTTGRVSRVKDQGACGSCWSFATVGALEAITAARNQSTLLSEQNLVDCSGQYGNEGCNGGLMDAALRYVRDFGIMSSRDYRYTAKRGTCQFDKTKSVLQVRGSVVLPRGSESLLRLALALTGPIPIAIDAGPRSFHSYKSGVYDDSACKNRARDLNHAVLLVGYGTTKSGGDYWIVKNSWGTKWGDNGYMKIARNRANLCGVASFAVLPIP